MVSEGAKAARIRHRLEGMCVKTMVLTSPNRLESDAATGKEKAERTPDQKKNRLAAESDRSNRSNNQRANSDWTTKPPANASRLHDRARRAERLRQIMLCWRRPARNARVEQA